MIHKYEITDVSEAMYYFATLEYVKKKKNHYVLIMQPSQMWHVLISPLKPLMNSDTSFLFSHIQKTQSF